MPKKPAWLAYAEKVKARMKNLPRNKESLAPRENLLLQSLFIARTRHGYPGYLGDWELVLEHADGGRNGNSARLSRKQAGGESVVKRPR